MTMTLGLAVMLGGVFAISATVGSALGFGFSAVGCLALILWGPEALPVLSGLSLVAPVYYLAHSNGFNPRAWLTTRGVKPAIAGGLTTLPAGLWLLHNLPSQTLKVALAAFLALTALFFFLAPHKEEAHSRYNNPVGMFFVGMLAGLTAGFASFPLAGVIAWLRYHNVRKDEMMALTQPILIVLQLAGIALSYTCLDCSADFYEVAIVLTFGLPGTIIGSWVGLKFLKALPQRAHGLATAAALAVCASVLVATASATPRIAEAKPVPKEQAAVGAKNLPDFYTPKWDAKKFWKGGLQPIWNPAKAKQESHS